MAISDKDLAGDSTIGAYVDVPLWAGDAEVITDDGYVVASGQGVVPKYSVVALLGGKLVKHAPAAVDGSQTAVGILTQAVNATVADAKVAIYVSGFFNEAALVWAAATNTLALRRAAFLGKTIRIGDVGLQ